VKHPALFAEDIIAVNIDTVEMEKGADVAMRLRGEDGGIPWSVILDADGNTLITSDGPEGNIGYPMNEAEIDYFMGMLRVARPGMNVDKGVAIREVLERYAETREF
jgi:hypothetical protein